MPAPPPNAIVGDIYNAVPNSGHISIIRLIMVLFLMIVSAFIFNSLL